jgi:hypothetical protein
MVTKFGAAGELSFFDSITFVVTGLETFAAKQMPGHQERQRQSSA